MRDDEPIERAVVYQHLGWSWSFYGLQLFHFALAGALTMAVFILAVLFGFNMLYGVAFFLAFSAGLAVVQWRKPATYIPDLLLFLLAPRTLTHLDDDSVTYPFPVPREEIDRDGD